MNIHNILSFGADPNGVEDSSSAIMTALDAISNDGGTLVLPSGKYKLSNQIRINKHNLVVEGYSATLVPDENLATPVIIGGGASRMNIRGLRVDRNKFISGSENTGFLFEHCYQCTFQDMESRWSAYNFWFAPENKGFGYNTIINMQAVGGVLNFKLQSIGSGWVNENVFIGGRAFGTDDTKHNLIVYGPETGSYANHNRFYGISLEISGTEIDSKVSAIYCDGNGNTFDQCRTEGYWSVADVILSKNSWNNFVKSARYDLDVIDHSTNNQVMLSTTGTKLFTYRNNTTPLHLLRKGANTEDKPVLLIEDNYENSGKVMGMRIKHNRYQGNTIETLFQDDLKFSVDALGNIMSKGNINVDSITIGNHKLEIQDNKLLVDGLPLKVDGKPISIKRNIFHRMWRGFVNFLYKLWYGHERKTS